jgi:hypothetical protein
MQEVIVSLTTIPNRLIDHDREDQGIRPGLRTLLEQTDIAYEVHLNIPYKHRDRIIYLPEWMSEWEARYPHLKIFRTFDYGAATKIYPTIQRVTNPDAIIIVADDDLLYVDGFIKSHLEARERYPDYAIGYAGITSIAVEGQGHYHFASSTPEDVRVRMLEGYKTVSYVRRMFDNELEQFLFTHWNDDVALSAYCGYKNIKKIVLKCPDCIDFSPRVESYPVINHAPILDNTKGCNMYRRDETIQAEYYALENIWYKLGYLER